MTIRVRYSTSLILLLIFFLLLTKENTSGDFRANYTYALMGKTRDKVGAGYMYVGHCFVVMIYEHTCE